MNKSQILADTNIKSKIMVLSVDPGWVTGCFLAFSASIIGAGSNLCIRKSYTMKIERKKSEQIIINDDNLQVVVDENSMLLLVEDGFVTPETSDEATSSEAEDNYYDKNYYEPTQSTISTSTSFRRQQRKVELHPCSLRALGVVGMTTLVPIFNILALHFASPSILMCFGSGLSLVFTVLFSQQTIGEQPSKKQIIGSVLIVIGVFTVAIFGDHTNEPEMDLFDVIQKYSDPYFVTYFFFFSLWIFFLLAQTEWGNPFWRRSAWGAVGGSLSGGTSNFIKDAMALGSSQVITDFITYYMLLSGLLLAAAVLSISSLILSLECMKRYEASFSCASYTGAMMFSVSIMSAVHYNTFSHLEGWLNFAFYILGLVVTMSGCLTLAQEPVDSEKDEFTMERKASEKKTQQYGSLP